MENAAPLFGLAAALFGSGFVIHALGYWWLRAKQLEIAERTTVGQAPLAAIEARLARIEQIVETTAVEVERVAEAQRFASRLLAEQRPQQSLVAGRSAEKA